MNMEQIDECLKNPANNSFSDADALYRIISNFSSIEERNMAFKYVCENYGMNPAESAASGGESEYECQFREIQLVYGEYVRGAMNVAVRSKLKTDEFYSKMYKFIMENEELDSDAKRIYALYALIVSDYVPYYELDVSNLYYAGNEKFQNVVSRYTRERCKVKFLKNYTFTQRTEEASAYLNLFGINATDSEYEMKISMMCELLNNEQPKN